MLMLRNDRNGFALPMVILVIGFMTAGALAGFARTASEVQLLDNQSLQTSAFAVAEAGLETYLAGNVVAAPQKYGYGSDTAFVAATLMRDTVAGTDTAFFLIRSVGVVHTGEGRPTSRRTVAQFAYRLRGQMTVLSSWTSLSGLRKNGASGEMTGNDACSDDVLPGVAVPTDGFDGQDAAISGDPPIQELPLDDLAAQVDINWIGITDPDEPAIDDMLNICLGGSGYIAEFGSCDSWPTAGQWANPDFWPTIMLNGSGNLPGVGRGTLVVTGNLTLRGGDVWDGIVLVGGIITDNGEGAIGGAVVTGLNVLKGEAVDMSSRANGTKSYTYDSCKVAQAANGQAKVVQLSNAWVDNWTAW
ncbi:MAG: hypothetical protein WD054_06875 [Gemmatimonadota bacterium]